MLCFWIAVKRTLGLLSGTRFQVKWDVLSVSASSNNLSVLSCRRSVVYI